MGKGSKRRPCNETKVRRNWPFSSFANNHAQRVDELKAKREAGRKIKTEENE
jgi:hypothetical protein